MTLRRRIRQLAWEQTGTEQDTVLWARWFRIFVHFSTNDTRRAKASRERIGS